MKQIIVVFMYIILVSGFCISIARAATVDVSVVDNRFQPENIIISLGDTVRWRNNGGLPHTSTSGIDGNSVAGTWDSGTMTSGETFSFTFNQSGSFPYHCTFHWFGGMKGTVTVNPAVSAIPVPTGQQTFLYNSIDVPQLSNDPSQAKPVSAGPVATGGSTVNIQIQLNQLAGDVDVYGAYSLKSDPATINILNPDGTSFSAFTLTEILSALAAGVPPAGALPWMENTTGPINENVFQTVVSNLPADVYNVYLLVTPTGGLVNYYLWVTLFFVP